MRTLKFNLNVHANIVAIFSCRFKLNYSRQQAEQIFINLIMRHLKGPSAFYVATAFSYAD
jgi:hypothetical protein